MACEIFKAAREVEEHIVELELVRSVIAEVEKYFDNKEKVEYLPYYSGQILNLIIVADRILFRALPNLEKVVNELLEKHKSEKCKKE